MLQIFLSRVTGLARIGLLAMALLSLGPLMGQLSAAHQGPQLDWICGDLEVVSYQHSHHGTHHSHVWYEQCEYCSLVQHFPFLSVHIPQFSAANSVAESGPLLPVSSAYRNSALFAHAPNRAPPI